MYPDYINPAVAIPTIIFLWIGMVIVVRWMNKKDNR